MCEKNSLPLVEGDLNSSAAAAAAVRPPRRMRRTNATPIAMTASAANSGPNNINVSTLPAALGGYGRVVVGNASGGSDIKMGSKGGGSGGSNDGGGGGGLGAITCTTAGVPTSAKRTFVSGERSWIASSRPPPVIASVIACAAAMPCTALPSRVSATSNTMTTRAVVVGVPCDATVTPGAFVVSATALASVASEAMRNALPESASAARPSTRLRTAYVRTHAVSLALKLRRIAAKGSTGPTFINLIACPGRSSARPIAATTASVLSATSPKPFRVTAASPVFAKNREIKSTRNQ